MANLQVGVAGNGTVTVGAGASVHSPASNTLTLGTNGDERVRIDSSGRMLMGTTAAVTGSDSQYASLQIEGNSYGSNTPGYLVLANAASISDGTPIGRIMFTGSGAEEYARIEGEGDGATGSNDYPGRLSFYTTADGASSSTERLRINSSGDVGIGTDAASCILDVVDNSSSGYIAEFKQVHASNSGQIIINSPTDSNLRPSYIDLAQAGTVKWSVGQVYASTSSQAFHICAGSSSQANSKLVISTGGQVGVNTSAFTSGSQFESNSEGAYNIIARSHNGNGGYHNFTGQSAGGTNTSYITHNGRGYFEDGVQFDSSGEVLDSYEEGTANATFKGAEGGSTSLSNAVRYTKIGNLVHVVFAANDFSNNGVGGVLEIGMPFTSTNDFGIAEWHGGDVYWYPSSKWDPSYSNHTGFNPYISANNAFCKFRVKMVDQDRQTTMSASNNNQISGASGLYCRFSITYTAA